MVWKALTFCPPETCRLYKQLKTLTPATEIPSHRECLSVISSLKIQIHLFPCDIPVSIIIVQYIIIDIISVPPSEFITM